MCFTFYIKERNLVQKIAYVFCNSFLLLSCMFVYPGWRLGIVTGLRWLTTYKKQLYCVFQHWIYTEPPTPTNALPVPPVGTGSPPQVAHKSISALLHKPAHWFTNQAPKQQSVNKAVNTALSFWLNPLFWFFSSVAFPFHICLKLLYFHFKKYANLTHFRWIIKKIKH